MLVLHVLRRSCFCLKVSPSHTCLAVFCPATTCQLLQLQPTSHDVSFVPVTVFSSGSSNSQFVPRHRPVQVRLRVLFSSIVVPMQIVFGSDHSLSQSPQSLQWSLHRVFLVPCTSRVSGFSTRQFVLGHRLVQVLFSVLDCVSGLSASQTVLGLGEYSVVACQLVQAAIHDVSHAGGGVVQVLVPCCSRSAFTANRHFTPAHMLSQVRDPSRCCVNALLVHTVSVAGDHSPQLHAAQEAQEEWHSLVFGSDVTFIFSFSNCAPNLPPSQPMTNKRIKKIRIYIHQSSAF